MGLAFPKRLLRSSFGPKLINNYPVENPSGEVGDMAFNAAFSAIAGMSQVAPRACCVALYTGGVFAVSYQAEAWNAEGDQARPVLARSGAGLYSYTFAASYLDEDGIAVPTDIEAARISCPSDSSGAALAEGFAWLNPSNPLQVLMRVGTRTTAGAFTNGDVRFWLEVL